MLSAETCFWPEISYQRFIQYPRIHIIDTFISSLTIDQAMYLEDL